MEEKKIRFFFRVINYSYFWGAGWGTHRLVKIFINKTNQYICVGVWRGGGALFRSSCRLKVLFFFEFPFWKVKSSRGHIISMGRFVGGPYCGLGKKIIQRMLCMYVRMSMCVCVCVCLGWGVLSGGSFLGEAFCGEII